MNQKTWCPDPAVSSNSRFQVIGVQTGQIVPFVEVAVWISGNALPSDKCGLFQKDSPGGIENDHKTYHDKSAFALSSTLVPLQPRKGSYSARLQMYFKEYIYIDRFLPY